MIPIRDSIPAERPPVVTIGLIVVNALVFFYELTLGPAGMETLFRQYGLVPLRLFSEQAWEIGGVWDQVAPIFAHMFLHGGWLHVISNLWFLWIFGDNVEGRMGHGRFLVFYLAAGLGGALAQAGTNPDSVVPMVGASGALSGVLGAYMLLFPQSRVLAIVPVFILLYTVELPAFIFLALWVGIQFVQGTVALGQEADVGGVAWFAHIGGFVVGVVVVLLWPRLRRERGREPRHRRYY